MFAFLKNIYQGVFAREEFLFFVKKTCFCIPILGTFQLVCVFFKQKKGKHTYRRSQKCDFILFYFRNLPSEINIKLKKNWKMIENHQKTRFLKLLVCDSESSFRLNRFCIFQFFQKNTKTSFRMVRWQKNMVFSCFFMKKHFLIEST